MSVKKYKILICIWSIIIATNGLRAGARNPVLRLRQGYGACTLLRAGLFLNHFKCLLHIFSCTEQINTYR
jgi:hypothetical protein